MKPDFYKQALEGTVAKVSAELIENMEPHIQKLVHISVNRAAGILEVHPDKIRRLFGKDIIQLGPRNHRVSLAAIQRGLDEIKEKQSRKPRRKSKA